MRSQTNLPSPATIEALGQFDNDKDLKPHRVTTTIDGCTVKIETTNTSGDRAGHLYSRDTFSLGAVRFENDHLEDPRRALQRRPLQGRPDDFRSALCYRPTPKGPYFPQHKR